MCLHIYIYTPPSPHVTRTVITNTTLSTLVHVLVHVTAEAIHAFGQMQELTMVNTANCR